MERIIYTRCKPGYSLNGEIRNEAGYAVAAMSPGLKNMPGRDLVFEAGALQHFNPMIDFHTDYVDYYTYLRPEQGLPMLLKTHKRTEEEINASSVHSAVYTADCLLGKFPCKPSALLGEYGIFDAEKTPIDDYYNDSAKRVLEPPQESLLKGVSCDRMQLRSFIDDGRHECVIRAAAHVMKLRSNHSEEKRMLLILDSEKNVRKWIQAICEYLPVDMTTEITFCTNLRGVDDPHKTYYYVDEATGYMANAVTNSRIKATGRRWVDIAGADPETNLACKSLRADSYPAEYVVIDGREKRLVNRPEVSRLFLEFLNGRMESISQFYEWLARYKVDLHKSDLEEIYTSVYKISRLDRDSNPEELTTAANLLKTSYPEVYSAVLENLFQSPALAGYMNNSGSGRRSSAIFTAVSLLNDHIANHGDALKHEPTIACVQAVSMLLLGSYPLYQQVLQNIEIEKKLISAIIAGQCKALQGDPINANKLIAFLIDNGIDAALICELAGNRKIACDLAETALARLVNTQGNKPWIDALFIRYLAKIEGRGRAYYMAAVKQAKDVKEIEDILKNAAHYVNGNREMAEIVSTANLRIEMSDSPDNISLAETVSAMGAQCGAITDRACAVILMASLITDIWNHKNHIFQESVRAWHDVAKTKIGIQFMKAAAENADIPEIALMGAALFIHRNDEESLSYYSRLAKDICRETVRKKGLGLATMIALHACADTHEACNGISPDIMGKLENPKICMGVQRLYKACMETMAGFRISAEASGEIKGRSWYRYGSKIALQTEEALNKRNHVRRGRQHPKAGISLLHGFRGK